MHNKYNVLMISVDQLGRNHMDIGGDSVNHMPTVRYLAEQGIDYDCCYSTCPVCIPARRSLMTGMYPRSHGDRVYNDTLEMPKVTTLAQAFREQGYQAYSVGKLHVYPQRDRIGFDDSVIVEEGRYEFGTVDDYQIWLGEQGYVGKEFSHGMGNNVYYTRPWHLPDYTHPTNWTTQKMCEMIKRKDPTRPALFYASYQFPHPPLVPLQTYLDQYRDVILPSVFEGDWLQESAILKEMRKSSEQYTAREKELARRAYYAQCTHIDHQIRLLIGTLRECNLIENTVIMFFSDHGDMLFDHGLVAKRSFYEASANIPMILSGKPIEERRGQTDHRLCCLEDVMPTLLNICGLEIPETVEGMSLLDKETRSTLYGEVGEGMKATRMIRDNRFKLIYYPCGNYVQLFDLQKDKEELHNCADIPEYAEVKRNMTGLLLEQLYGKDLSWVKEGTLVGEVFNESKGKGTDYGLYNQRGYHWPTPQQYSSIGKNA